MKEYIFKIIWVDGKITRTRKATLNKLNDVAHKEFYENGNYLCNRDIDTIEKMGFIDLYNKNGDCIHIEKIK
ncbi:hypothetical protein [Stenotrophomonas maltophilia group sp. RNC7]|uniref:hypothetical protein n=1 Tax=Stenotrophomonas maltophilia group sp. RNC7 TaxID=3071467 RepID=UPI0027DF89CE|nr:hypothetical protein [Stenotrophomonas maltophilia group sp. RNC7]MDQ4678121.1 hypothetical protein [Stenotrophomonas maltophilia group sp. RNC7]